MWQKTGAILPWDVPMDRIRSLLTVGAACEDGLTRLTLHMRRIDQRSGPSRLVRRRHGRPIRWHGGLAVVVALLAPTALTAQVLPAEPFALAGGRLVVSGDVSATVADTAEDYDDLLVAD